MDGAEIGTIHEEVGGKRVAESVGGDMLGDAGFPCVFFDETLDGASGETAVIAGSVGSAIVAAVAKEERGECVGAGGEVFADAIGGGFGNENGAVFAAFTTDHEFATIEIDKIAVEADKFGNTETGGKEKLDDGAVAKAGFGVEIDFVDHVGDFIGMKKSDLRADDMG